MKTGILLVNLGTPEAPAVGAVRRYLIEFLSDPRVVPLPRLLWLPLLHGVIAPVRAPRLARSYRAIWMAEGSPLAVYSQRLARSLGQLLDMPVTVAMRYGSPGLAEGIETLLWQRVERIQLLPLYPQYSRTTTASVFDQVCQFLARRPYQPSFCFRSDYHDEPAYIRAVAASIHDFWQTQGRPQKLLMSFHGLPEKSRRQGDPYYDQCRTSARLIAQALGLADNAWQLVFQSRFGFARWLEPHCLDVLKQLPGQGIREVDVVCPGFAVDCLETLEEIARTNREVFLEAGGRQYRYIPALNDSARHVEMLAALIGYQS
ncbi:MAG TPA: ferrochelatase [Methylothermaceae bacterium]|nr:ferrochelatase [Methylothermaceae bacterium]